MSTLSTAWDHVQLLGDRVWAKLATDAGRDPFSLVRAYAVFVGHPRSAHTLVGSLLNAHPEMVISHELDALRYVRTGFSRDAVFRLILRRDAEFTTAGSKWGAFDYSVPSQFQGRYSRLRVIGDKKAGASSFAIRRDPGILDRLRELVGVRVCVLHVVRNPFDNIATMLRHGRKGLAHSIRGYFRLCEGPAVATRRMAPGDVITVRHERFVRDTREVLTELCRFLGVEVSAEYLDSAATRVRPSPRLSRHEAPWTPAAIGEVTARMAEFEFLAGYTFDD